ncbi:ABC transporter ATP-binding protein [Bacillaceae bacterium SIJ1]|uniref:ABC transporter ATP-binding protein n=1 Tax=Litoribacterium kuwaitense TaxID=1398745 RepID=UPI0013EAB17F|nr:ABC transporter ATP-binding protein [Litoribacterium kuwaitense]NGP46218.1 ABC transporter ATP-binding protein [Litoribacterium kuwaitense]
MSLIQIKSVSKSFKGMTLFQNTSAEFNKGKIYGIVGPNGSGKSVLFKMICGFILPDKGSIAIDPEYVDGKRGFPSNFGIIIDRPGYLAGKTGFENLHRLAALRKQITDDEIAGAMERVGLQPDATQKVKNYSLGMKQKLALAQAFMEHQEVLILDEPFNALDADSVENIRALLQEFKSEGKTIILTSHQQEDINLLCDEVYQIKQHRLHKR